jgi:hypothetical protein
MIAAMMNVVIVTLSLRSSSAHKGGVYCPPSALILFFVKQMQQRENTLPF